MRNPKVRSRLAVLIPGTVLGVAIFANFIQFGARVVLSAVLPSIIDDYSMSRDRIGLVLTLMWAVFALFELPSACRRPDRLFVLLGVVLVSVGFGWGGVIQSQFVDNFTNVERSSGFGVARTVYTLVGSLGSVTTGYLADRLDWSAAFGLLVVLLALGVGCIVFVNYADQ